MPSTICCPRPTDDRPGAERKKLRRIVRKAHLSGRRVRFWATPDNVDLWEELNQAGVDLINTDDLAGLARFLREHSSDRSAAPLYAP